MNEDIRTLIALTFIRLVGPERIRMLLAKVRRPSEVFSLNYHQIIELPGIGEAIAESILTFDEWEKVDALIEQTERLDATIVPFYHEYYPERLRQIYDAPLLLWVRGNPEVLSNPGIAIIGTRQPTRYGIEMAEHFAKGAVQNRFTVFSGLAYGIDTVAHSTTVKEGGVTVGVLGSGIDVIYPAKNRQLVKQIIESGGAIITELTPGTQPDAGNFPERNRIVSGLSLGSLVVETPLKGGSRITAHLALDQNREVFVIPHNLDNDRGIGCNDLIKKGYGKLVQSFDDLIEEIPLAQKMGLGEAEGEHEIPVSEEHDERIRWEEEGVDEFALEICALLQEGVNQIDDLAEALNVRSHEVLVQLLDLEFKGLVKQKAGKLFEFR